jgi:hypothetical protein
MKNPDFGAFDWRTLKENVGELISRSYPSGDYHRLYVGAIEGAWRRG